MYQLQLAEGPNQVNYNDVEFILVPDPMNQKRPIYMKETLFRNLSPEAALKFFKFVAPFNTPDKMTRVVARYQAKHGLSDDGEGGDSGTDWGAIVETVGDVVTVIGDLFGSSSGGSTPADPGSFVNPAGWVYCTRAINGNVTGFAVQPAYKSLIAFSSPDVVRQFFPKLPANVPALPSIVPTAMLNLALTNPNKIIKMKPGGGYDILPLSSVGIDNAGNPVDGTQPPKPDPVNGGPPPGDDSENGAGGAGGADMAGFGKWALPLALIAGLAYMGSKK